MIKRAFQAALRTIAAPFVKTNPAGEGNWHPGPYSIFTGGGWGCLPAGTPWNFWQSDIDPVRWGPSAIVEACVSAYSQTVATCPLIHWRSLANGGREEVRNSALTRVMRQPNSYQTRSDFLLNAVRSLFLDGNAYALGLRNDRFEIEELHLFNPRYSGADILHVPPDRETGFLGESEIFYHLSGNEVIETAFFDRVSALQRVPQRDVFHVKLHCPITPLRGETPLMSAAMAVGASNAMGKQMLTFFNNMSRPSGVLSTDLTLSKLQMEELRAAWDEKSKGINAGAVPILQHGIKWVPLSMSAEDSQFIDMMKFSDNQIAQVFRVPLPLVGSEAQPLGSTEALMTFWLQYGLEFVFNQIENAFDRTFRLTASGEYSEFDRSVLLRSAFRDRIEALARGVQGGIYSPNEARAQENLPETPMGEEPRVQQQVVPLSWPGFTPAPAAAPPSSAPPVAANDDQQTVEQAMRAIEDAAMGMHEKRLH